MTTQSRITRVALKNYKSIAACDVPLGPLTILVGPNGAGKSNFLDAMRFCRDALRTPLDQVFAKRNTNLHHLCRAPHAAGSGLRKAQHEFAPFAPSLTGESGELGNAVRFRVGRRAGGPLQLRNRTAVPTRIRGSSRSLRYPRLRWPIEAFVRSPVGLLRPFQRPCAAHPCPKCEPAVSRKCLWAFRVSARI